MNIEQKRWEGKNCIRELEKEARVRFFTFQEIECSLSGAHSPLLSRYRSLNFLEFESVLK